MATESFPAAEFQALPLEFIIAAPLNAAVKAQAIAAESTRDFLESLKDQTVKLKASAAGAGGAQEVTVDVPLLAVVPVPHLRIDSLTVTFKYEISQVVVDKQATDKEFGIEAGTQGLLSKFFKATVKGAVTSRASTEATLSRSGTLEITVHASEAPIPEGLARVLSLLAHAVPPPPGTALP